jgi:hypothetical protein
MKIPGQDDKMRTSRLVLGAALVGLLLAGCGDGGSKYPTVKVAGNITVGGQPLPKDAEGTITFMPAAGGGQASPASSPIVDGKYQVDEAPLGKVNVLFNITRLTGRMIREDNIPTAAPHAERENLVPATAQTGITVEITADENSRNFEL